VPRDSGSGALGKRGSTVIRGPNRIDVKRAELDIEEMIQAFKIGGSAEVRKAQQALNRDWIK